MLIPEFQRMGAGMSDWIAGDVLAFVPKEMQDVMRELEAAVPCHLRRAGSIEELAGLAAEESYSVVLLPATGFTTEQWWSIWGRVQAMAPRPSILVYALRSDFELWSSVLDSGGYDVVVAPFSAEKLERAVRAAAAEFLRQNDG